MVEPIPASVVIPTIGRVPQLRACLESLARCRPPAAEILVVDQSADEAVAELVRRAAPGARVIASDERGIGSAVNAGVREAAHELVLVTHDDCTVEESWVATAARLMEGERDLIVSGRVLAAGDPRAVPSTRHATRPHDHTGELNCGALYPNNMAARRSELIAFGGFDERFPNAAEDNDLCYRWLRAGRRLRFEPDLVVWHHDWRSHDELARLYVRYWRAQGRVYAKHLRSGDLTVLRFIAWDLKQGARAGWEAIARGRPRWSDWRRGVLRGLPAGLAIGWREFGRQPGAAAAAGGSGGRDGPRGDRQQVVA